MLNIPIPIIVEGKYDREKILSVADAVVITTDGFGIFNKKEKLQLIRRLGEKHGVIVITDSDGAGLVIRNHVHAVLPKDKIFDIYTPEIKGKEKRKESPSKAGLLGVEGMSKEWVISALTPFAKGKAEKMSSVTKTDFYLLGLSGGDESAKKRAALAEKLSLPSNLSCSALIEAINLTVSEEELRQALKKISGGQDLKNSDNPRNT